jgi:hypothetical protein
MPIWNDSEFRGGHSEEWVDAQMIRKDIETEGGYSAKMSGDRGELSLSSILKSLPDCYHVMDDVMLKTKKGTTQIDHIIVSPFGIFVVETKNHKGLIFGDCYGQVWTQVLNGRGHFRLYSPVLQNLGHMQNLSKQIKLPMNYMQGVIVFTNQEANLSNVNCPFCFNIDQFYGYIMQFQNVIFTDAQVVKAIERIDKVDINSYMNRQRHIQYVNSIKERRGY